MPLWRNTDAHASKPKIPQMRLSHGIIKLSANALTFPDSVIRFAHGATANLALGMVANSANMGNVSGTTGFNQTGPYIIALTGNTVTLSQNLGGGITAGEIVSFSKTINFKANTLAGRANANTYMVTSARLANAATGTANAVGHIGWNKVVHGSGFVKSVTITSPGRGYKPTAVGSNFITFTANNAFGSNGAGANVSYAVNANSYVTNTHVYANGTAYVVTPNHAVSINAVALKYVSAVAITNGGAGYSNGYLIFTGGNGSGANASYLTNTAGSIVSVTLLTSGGGWGSTPPTADGVDGTAATFNITMANGSNAIFSTVMGGRANRVQVETLVALSNAYSIRTDSGGQDFPGL